MNIIFGKLVENQARMQLQEWGILCSQSGTHHIDLHVACDVFSFATCEVFQLHWINNSVLSQNNTVDNNMAHIIQSNVLYNHKENHY